MVRAADLFFIFDLDNQVLSDTFVGGGEVRSKYVTQQRTIYISRSHIALFCLHI